MGAPTYADLDDVAMEMVRHAPERMLWGTDWPHPLVTTEPKPDDAVMLDKLLLWAPYETIRHQILVDNPTRVYWAS